MDGSDVAHALSKHDMSTLRVLELQHGPTGPDLLEGLAQLPLASHVEVLKLGRLGLTDDDVPRLQRAT